MSQCMDADNLHRRLRKIIGQVQAIDRMVDEDVPCEDVLAQINAAKSALHKVGQVVLEGHIQHCVRDGIEHHSGKVRAQTLEGQCVHLADRIAYLNHDIDDAIRGGVLTREELPVHALRKLGMTHGERVGNMIASVVRASRVYARDWAADDAKKAMHIVTALVRHYTDHPSQLPNEYLEITYREGTQRGVCDFVACMTDAYAVKTYQKLFIPPFFGGIG